MGKRGNTFRPGQKTSEQRCDVTFHELHGNSNPPQKQLDQLFCLASSLLFPAFCKTLGYVSRRRRHVPDRQTGYKETTTVRIVLERKPMQIQGSHAGKERERNVFPNRCQTSDPEGVRSYYSTLHAACAYTHAWHLNHFKSP